MMSRCPNGQKMDRAARTTTSSCAASMTIQLTTPVRRTLIRWIRRLTAAQKTLHLSRVKLPKNRVQKTNKFHNGNLVYNLCETVFSSGAHVQQILRGLAPLCKTILSSCASGARSWPVILITCATWDDNLVQFTCQASECTEIVIQTFLGLQNYGFLGLGINPNCFTSDVPTTEKKKDSLTGLDRPDMVVPLTAAAETSTKPPETDKNAVPGKRSRFAEIFSSDGAPQPPRDAAKAASASPPTPSTDVHQPAEKSSVPPALASILATKPTQVSPAEQHAGRTLLSFIRKDDAPAPGKF